MTIPAIPMQLLVEAKEHRADLHISGDITKGVQFLGMTFKNENDVEYNDVAEALKDLPDDVTEIAVHINSYGGEVAEGVAIYNALRSHNANVTTICEGFACSIASVVFMAGDRRIMRDSSLLMLHNASMPANGDANAHRKAASDLDVITEISKTAYLNHATEELTAEKLSELMDAETWVTPEQALEWGLATEIDKPAESDEPSQSARALVMQTLTMPQRLAALPNPPSMTEQQIEQVVTRLIGSGPLDTTEEWLSEISDFRDKLFTRMDELEQLITTTPKEPDPDPDPEPTPISNRYARIFEKLSNM